MFFTGGSDSLSEDQEQLLPGPQFPSMSTLDHDSTRRRQYLQRLRSPRVLLWKCIAFMCPSFLSKTAHAPTSSESSTTEKITAVATTKQNSTEYLDGVRGVASLIVFILHWSHLMYPSVNSGWGYGQNTSLWLLPFVRLVFSGAAMVAVFFVVSGFVLTHRFVRRMHRREYPELFSALTSIAFRRAVRLFLPAFASSSLAFLGVCLGLVGVPAKVRGHKGFVHGWAAYLEYLDMESDPWTWKPEFFGFYNPQLWSIAVEFRGSMVVFLMVVALAKTRPLVRVMVEGVVVVHAFAHRRWDVALFVSGMLIAELQVIVEKNQPKSPPRRWRRLVDVSLVLILILGVFLSGYPRDHNTKTPGYMWSKNVWPYGAYRRRFWLAVGAILIMGPMAFLPSVQSVFLTRPARYLGRISFALYLVHGLGNRTIGDALINCCWQYIGKDGYWAYNVSFVVATIVYFPLVIWASDIFWRAVDIPSTNFARWLEKSCAS